MVNIQREVTGAVMCSMTIKLCYGGFLQSKVIARDGKLVSLKQPVEEEEEEENDRSRMVPL